MEKLKEKINSFIDDNIEDYKKIALEIHDNPEVSNYEFKSCKILSDKLIQEGFDVKNLDGAYGLYSKATQELIEKPTQKN